jgi:predicted enzyme related to lactoylglutathione lyase
MHMPPQHINQGFVMKFASVRLIAADIHAMVSFYEVVTQTRAQWLAIGATETLALFAAGSAEPGANRTAILEWQVDDIDAEYARLKEKVTVLQGIKMMPWGNKTFQFRDPEGTLVAIYMPATDAAVARFAAR